jgi:hypothetical protein
VEYEVVRSGQECSTWVRLSASTFWLVSFFWNTFVLLRLSMEFLKLWGSRTWQGTD